MFSTLQFVITLFTYCLQNGNCLIVSETLTQLNPTVPLENPKHELFAQNIIKTNGDAALAYKLTYGVNSDGAAKTNASRVLTNSDYGVKDRVRYLLDRSAANLPNIIQKKMGQWLEAKRPIITVNGVEGYCEDTGNQIEAGKVALKLYGALSADNSVNIDARQLHQTTINNNIGELTVITDKLLELNKALGIADEPSGVVDVEKG